jgi:hypothetical protein
MCCAAQLAIAALSFDATAAAPQHYTQQLLSFETALQRLHMVS